MWTTNWFYFILLLYNPKQHDIHVTNESNDRPAIGSRKRPIDPSIGGQQCSLDTTVRVNRFVGNCIDNLVQKLDSLVAESSAEVLDIKLRSVVTARDVHILRQYLPLEDYESLNCEQLEEFEDSIRQFIDGLVVVNDRPTDRPFIASLFSKQNIYDFIQNVLQTVFVLSAIVSVAIIATYLSRKQYLRQTMSNIHLSMTAKTLVTAALVVVIMASIGWKWRQKYLIELSRKQCYVLQTPQECLNRHQELSFISWIRHYMYSYEQRQHDYYRAITVDPFWEINPLTVAAELGAELVLTPLKSLGHFLGLFLSSYFSHIPFYLVIPVFVFLCFTTLLLVLLLAVWLLMPNKYSIKIPFLMTIHMERRHKSMVGSHEMDSLPSNEQKIVRKYQIQANIVNVYHSIPPNNCSFDNTLNENQIKFDENMCFKTEKAISIPYSEVD